MTEGADLPVDDLIIRGYAVHARAQAVMHGGEVALAVAPRCAADAVPPVFDDVLGAGDDSSLNGIGDVVADDDGLPGERVGVGVDGHLARSVSILVDCSVRPSHCIGAAGFPAGTSPGRGPPQPPQGRPGPGRGLWCGG